MGGSREDDQRGEGMYLIDVYSRVPTVQTGTKVGYNIEGSEGK